MLLLLFSVVSYYIWKLLGDTVVTEVGNEL